MLMGEVRAEGLWRAIDPAVREGLSAGQEDAIRTAAREDAWQAHPVDIRLALPSPLGRFYIALVGGRENRSASRLAVERGRHPLAGGANLAVICALAAVLALAGFGLHGLL
jgi:hypothetical protein